MSLRTTVHEMRNHLAVAVANVEAFIDGKLEPSPSRLRNVLQVLNEIDVLIDELSGVSGALPAESESSAIDSTEPNSPAR